MDAAGSLSLGLSGAHPQSPTVDAPRNQSQLQSQSQSQSQSQALPPLHPVHPVQPPPPPPPTKTTTIAASSSSSRRTRFSPNYIHTQAASPEIISSLIDQLSAISASTQSHFDSLPTSPRLSRSRSRSRSRSGSGSGRGSRSRSPSLQALRSRNALWPDDSSNSYNNNNLAAAAASSTTAADSSSTPADYVNHDDDACEPPVVRTSKPPSGLSPLTAPPRSKTKNKKCRDKHSSLTLTGYIGRSYSYSHSNSHPGSSASLHSCHSTRSSTSFGDISIDPAPPLASKPVTSARSSAESKRSVRRPRSLMYMSSREQLKQQQKESRRTSDDSDTASLSSPRKSTAPLVLYEDTIREEPLTRDEGDADSFDLHQQQHHHHHQQQQYPTDADPATRFAHRYNNRTSSPARRLRLNLVDEPPPSETIQQGLVPDRGSSLRHGSPTKKSRRSGGKMKRERRDGEGDGRKDDRKDDRERGDSRKEEGTDSREKSADVRESTDVRGSTDIRSTAEDEHKQRLLLELEQEQNEVAQRIKQLREQKLLRDKMAALSPDASPTAVASPSPEERGIDCTKAHKLLGISAGSTPSAATTPADDHATPTPPLRSSTENNLNNLNKPLPPIDPHPHPREPTRPPPLPPHLRHARHRSLTVNDTDDLPLPINYALALKTLDTSAPNSPRTPRVDSTHMTLPLPAPSIFSAASTHSANSMRDSTREGVKRSSSVSVGGRSALGRRANGSAMGLVRGHKHSSSLTEGRPPNVRSASEEISGGEVRSERDVTPHREDTASRHSDYTSGRYSSLSMASASNSFTLQQKKTLKKKRWSHPDLPAKAEKAHNSKVDAQDATDAEARRSHYPVNPWSPVIEERPSSLDSIDMDVDAYLRAPRLSQKIRHPHTGRIISFSEVGDPNGFAVFVCVGMGLTRFVMAFYDQLAATLKLRLITPERPGINGSQVDPNGTPLTWPDDVLLICQALKITKFSLLAHSAGAIYALATSLRMPQHIRGRVHLLAPWIPPSQMAPIGIGRDSPPTQQLPRSQRFLRALPPSLLRVANSTFLSNTSASLQRTGPTKAPKPRRKTTAPLRTETPPPRPSLKDNRRESMLMMDQILPTANTLTLTASHTHDPSADQARLDALSAADLERQRALDERLTFAIWDRATAGANPATDLIVCLETKHPIGFRYEDINRPVVIHHGSKDSRVPVDNVRWLGKLMRKCEVRVLEGEAHGLMASASVMGNVLTEMAGDWEDWTAVVKQASVGDLRGLARSRRS